MELNPCLAHYNVPRIFNEKGSVDKTQSRHVSAGS